MKILRYLGIACAVPLAVVASLLALAGTLGLVGFIVAVVLSTVVAIAIFGVSLIPLAAVTFAIFALINSDK